MNLAAIVLAAGRGERMRPLTDHCPKPLLHVRGKPLLAWHLQALVQSGVERLVLNTAWLGHAVREFVHTQQAFHTPNGPATGVSVAFSDEQADFGGALETAGGIARALPLLGAPFPNKSCDAFWVVAGDVFVPSFQFSRASAERFLSGTALAHLWLVPNPTHKPTGDFGLSADGRALNTADLVQAHAPPTLYTYSAIGLFRPALFAPPWCNMAPGNPTGVKAALAPLLRRAMDEGRVTAELYTGDWTDVGTPQRLAELNTPPEHLTANTKAPR